MNLSPRNGANLRGILYIIAGMVVFTQGDAFFANAPGWAKYIVGLIGSAVIAWRAFIDTSNATANKAEADATTTPTPPTSGTTAAPDTAA